MKYFIICLLLGFSVFACEKENDYSITGKWQLDKMCGGYTGLCSSTGEDILQCEYGSDMIYRFYVNYVIVMEIDYKIIEIKRDDKGLVYDIELTNTSDNDYFDTLFHLCRLTDRNSLIVDTGDMDEYYHRIN